MIITPPSWCRTCCLLPLRCAVQRHNLLTFFHLVRTALRPVSSRDHVACACVCVCFFVTVTNSSPLQSSHTQTNTPTHRPGLLARPLLSLSHALLLTSPKAYFHGHHDDDEHESAGLGSLGSQTPRPKQTRLLQSLLALPCACWRTHARTHAQAFCWLASLAASSSSPPSLPPSLRTGLQHKRQTPKLLASLFHVTDRPRCLLDQDQICYSKIMQKEKG